MTTTAQQISAMFDDCGLTFTTGEDVHIMDVCDQLATVSEHLCNKYKFTFDDMSVIVIQDECWDLGYSACWCMREGGHTKQCLDLRTTDDFDDPDETWAGYETGYIVLRDSDGCRTAYLAGKSAQKAMRKASIPRTEIYTGLGDEAVKVGTEYVY